MIESLLFLFLVIGFLIRKNYKNYGTLRKWINNYLIYFGLPLLILIGLNDLLLKDMAKLSWIYIVIFIPMYIFYFFIIKNIKDDKKTKASLFLSSSFGNWAYIGIAISNLFFGSVGLLVALLLNTLNAITHFTLGIFLSNRYVEKNSKALKDMFKFAPLYGFVIAIFISRLDITYPEIIVNLSKSAIYIAIFIIGLSLEIKKIKKDFILGLLIKFIISPIIVFIALYFIDIEQKIKWTILLLSATPSAMINASLAVKYKFDDIFAAEFISVTTIIFLVVVFIFSLFV